MVMTFTTRSDGSDATTPVNCIAVHYGLVATLLVVGFALGTGCRSTALGSRNDSSLRGDTKVNAMMPSRFPAHSDRSPKRGPVSRASDLAKEKLPPKGTPEYRQLLKEFGSLSKTVAGDSRRKPFRPTGNCKSKMIPRRVVPLRPVPSRENNDH